MIYNEKLLSDDKATGAELMPAYPGIEARGILRGRTSRSTFIATSAGPLQLRSFCPPVLVERLHADNGLRAFARLPEREHALLLQLAQRPDSAVTLAYTPTREIVGQATLAPADGSWGGNDYIYEIAIEVSSTWRRLGLARHLLNAALSLYNLEDLVILAIGLSWHWDTEGLDLTRFDYRQLIARLLAAHAFVEYATTEANITMDPANILLARIGQHANVATVNHFFDCMLRLDDLSGL